MSQFEWLPDHCVRIQRDEEIMDEKIERSPLDLQPGDLYLLHIDRRLTLS